MPLIEWNSGFMIGIQEIDLHHQHLVFLLNQIYDGYKTNIPTINLNAVIVELIDYAKYHFSYEELSMREHQYPEYTKHVEEHETFTNRVIEFQKDFKLGKNVSLEMISFLNNWIMFHILKTDAKYGAFVGGEKIYIELSKKFA